MNFCFKNTPRRFPEYCKVIKMFSWSQKVQNCFVGIFERNL